MTDVLFFKHLTGMLRLLKFATPHKAMRWHFLHASETGFVSSSSSSFSTARIAKNSVAIFWDLYTKPPKSFLPFSAAVKLKAAAASFGVVRYMIAYANHRALMYAPPKDREQRKQRKMANPLDNKEVKKPAQSYTCRVCGRNFFNHEKLINHFKQSHEREHVKRLRQIESARGSMRLKLVGRYSMKMEKYKNAARDILAPKEGYELSDELKRAGFSVRIVSDEPELADVALRTDMVDVMDKRMADCLVLVSDESDFTDILNEAKLRCVKTVVVGDVNDGVLKRIADASFSWKEIMMGKAMKEAVSLVGRWKDRDILKRLEWKYNPKEWRRLSDLDDEHDVESDDKDAEDIGSKEDDGFPQKGEGRAWWELDSIKGEFSSK